MSCKDGSGAPGTFNFFRLNIYGFKKVVSTSSVATATSAPAKWNKKKKCLLLSESDAVMLSIHIVNGADTRRCQAPFVPNLLGINTSPKNNFDHISLVQINWVANREKAIEPTCKNMKTRQKTKIKIFAFNTHLNMPVEKVRGLMLMWTSLYSLESKYPPNPCNIPASVTIQRHVPCRRLSMGSWWFGWTNLKSSAGSPMVLCQASLTT